MYYTLPPVFNQLTFRIPGVSMYLKFTSKVESSIDPDQLASYTIMRGDPDIQGYFWDGSELFYEKTMIE